MFNEIGILLSIKLRSVLNFWTRGNNQTKALFPFSLAFIFIFLLTLFFIKIFSFLKDIPIIGSLVAQKTIDLAMLGILGFLILSNVVTAFGNLFQDREIPFLLKSRLKEETIFIFKFIETSVYSSWATLLLAIPLIFSYLFVFGIGTLNLILVLLGFPLFLLLASLIGFLLLFFLIRIFPKMRREGAFLIITIFFGVYFAMYIKFFHPEIFKLFKTESLETLALYLSRLGSVSPVFLPSRWMANLFLKNELSTILFSFVLFPLSLLFLSPVLYLVTSLHFEEHRQKGKRKVLRKKLPRIYSGFKAVWEKELKGLYRDFGQLSQGLFLILLVVFYIVAVRRTPVYFEHPFWHIFVGFANFGFLGYLIATFGIRFLYPSHSLEAQGVALFKTSPRNSFFYFFSKTSFWIIVFVLMGYILYDFTHLSMNLKLPEVFRWVFGLSLALESVIIAVLSFSFGVIFPSFGEKNPSKIASNPGGLLSALVAIGYVVSSALLFAQPLYFHFKTYGKHLPYLSFVITLFILLSLFIFFFSFLYGLYFFKRQEI